MVQRSPSAAPATRSADLRLTTATNGVPAALSILVDPTPSTTDIGNIPFANVPDVLNYAGVNGKVSATLPIYFTGSDQGNVTVAWDFPWPGAGGRPRR